MVCEAKENMGDSQMSNSILALNQLKQMVRNPHIDHWYEAIEELQPLLRNVLMSQAILFLSRKISTIVL